MAHTVNIESPSEWLCRLSINSLCALIIFFILKSEIKQRNKILTTFTKPFKYLSILCLIAGFLCPLLFAIGYIPVLCTFSNMLAVISCVSQGLFMSYYQLYRLYYCFANEQMHSKKGYPKSLFYFMYIIGFIFCINWMIIDIIQPNGISRIHSTCRYNLDNFQFTYYSIYISPPQNFVLFAIINTMLYWIWDLSILFMYIYKIKTLQKNDRSNEPKTQQRIVSILNKITILTLFYQIVGFSSLLFGRIAQLFSAYPLIIIIAYQLISASITLSWTYSMYLMMDHNQIKYVMFLSAVKYLKCHWICCCWRHKVIDQLNELNLKLKRKIKHKKNELSKATTNDVTISNELIEFKEEEEEIEEEEIQSSNQTRTNTIILSKDTSD